MNVNAVIGLRAGDTDQVRAIKVFSEHTDPFLLGYVLLSFYQKRTCTLPLVLGGSAESIGETFLSTRYNKLEESQFYNTAHSLTFKNCDSKFFYVQDTDNTWYVCFGEPDKWIRLDSIVTGVSYEQP